MDSEMFEGLIGKLVCIATNTGSFFHRAKIEKRGDSSFLAKLQDGRMVIVSYDEVREVYEEDDEGGGSAKRLLWQ